MQPPLAWPIYLVETIIPSLLRDLFFIVVSGTLRINRFNTMSFFVSAIFDFS